MAGRLVELERESHQPNEEDRQRQDPGYRERTFRPVAEPGHIRPPSSTRARNWRVRSSLGAEKICSGGPSSQMTPASRKQTLFATSRAKLISWVARIIVIPAPASSRT